jgi:nucleoside-diphosphate-sugar epimerase
MHSKITEPINLGSDELVTINGLVDLVEDIAGVRLKRTYNLSAPKGVNGRNSDNKKIKALLGWAPGISLREGLEKTYAWIYDRMGGRCARPVYSFQPPLARPLHATTSPVDAVGVPSR